jgi:hypothetical protein
MKKLTYAYVSIVILLAVMPQAAAESLKVDFNGNNWGDVIVQTQYGFEAYNALGCKN